MEQFLSELSLKTHGEGFTDITNDINSWIKKKKIRKGILIITSKHTSCSLIINENADPRVLEDLSAYMKAIVPEIGFKSILDNGKIEKYLHSEEGVDDMPAHIRTTLTSSSLTLSINESKLDLGVWQAVYLWEHRYSDNIRNINLHSICETLKPKPPDSHVTLNTTSINTHSSKINKIALNNYSSIN
ncbi:MULTISPECIES: secondary thiamine-phosphate synthase enzyme YjbQ [Prochlorococcus]|uniref:Uncharacterized conserved protein n=1 Tax=Prochlorococcus marinus (strain SARG / CCMP1375 / SS120) TaxID=167539 RepID=Q7VD92_PROMA|nr:MULTISPECIES: secondary thiamine-phosphate synthase enzyme YjbQ [Prochlorococcus]AAP99536.1 Uncharacterized conserved protein [Prochlorococcus marinus subsp. marinus str. CCMP1375]KGG11191.1 hypothetical protein EV04_1266 [Prochlorococcus marinus str. LG]KGG21529.1 hypothetical protein EV08_0616 [Prochlorococcus marinus str. SS2]KGG23127.1 hypothetical protein EV09_1873 [Prochlorococcus marinus str. SS35]KGG33837.1 hypothetical protein EV10_0274 [Prochlorococcus marinus str. SS51]